VPARVFHISDLHIGRREASEPFAALAELIREHEPELVLATGDLAHRGRRAQLERASELLGQLGVPVLVVPGNHDIPYTFPARYTRTFAEWERAFGPTEPAYRSTSFSIVGLNSVRKWRQQGGSLTAGQLRRLAERFGHGEPVGPIRVAALHHHLAAPPWRPSRKRPLKARNHALQALAAAGVELVASGHVHQAAIVDRREFEILDEDTRRSIVLATAAGFGRPRLHRRGEAQGFNVYEADPGALTVTTYAWDGTAFAVVGRRTFPRG